MKSILRLSETEVMNITHFQRGNGLISTNNNNITVEFKASNLEKELITTDRQRSFWNFWSVKNRKPVKKVPIGYRRQSYISAAFYGFIFKEENYAKKDNNYRKTAVCIYPDCCNYSRNTCCKSASGSCGRRNAEFPGRLI